MIDLHIFDQKPVMFKDRYDAGHQLAHSLQKYKNENSLVLALPRGGVVVGYEVAKALEVPLDVIIARKVGVPGNEEFGIGAIGEGDVFILDESTVQLLGISQEEIQDIIKKEEKELNRRVELYRNNKQLPSLHGRTVVLVDDGLATGVTAQAAIKSILQLKPVKVVFAVPVCASETAEKIKKQVEDFICLYCPLSLYAIGRYYKDFSATSDQEVIHLLKDIREKYPETLIH